MAVQTYSMSTQADLQVGQYFKVREFACHDGSDTVLIDDELVNRLDRIRTVFGSGITITSGYRTPSYNASPSVGGARNSQHTKGTAADIQVRGVPPLAVASFYEETFSTGGLGIYNTFTHVDTRNRTLVIWKNSGSNTVSSTGASEGYWKDYQNAADPGGGSTDNDSGTITVIIKRLQVTFTWKNGNSYVGNYFPSETDTHIYFNDNNFYRCKSDFSRPEKWNPDQKYWSTYPVISNITYNNIYTEGASDG